ncbi:hypothetical protein [Haloarcula sp. CBA1129]|uniref:hypothetical protein n=1 Tax=Haloarcula sp. CBA1129 TaxID=1853684 RepID=UPI001CDA39AB|nr:hypothetical protein [Haloarcula sp. CBA1129]
MTIELTDGGYEVTVDRTPRTPSTALPNFTRGSDDRAKLTVEGGSAAGVVVAILLAIGIIALSAWITVVAYRGYRKSGDRRCCSSGRHRTDGDGADDRPGSPSPPLGISSLLTTAAAVGVNSPGWW